MSDQPVNCIHHHSPYLQFGPEHLAICGYDRYAALILALYDYQTSLAGVGEPIYLSELDIHKRLTFSKNTVRRKLRKLVELCFLVAGPRAGKQSYVLNVEEVNRRVGEWLADGDHNPRSRELGRAKSK